MDRNKGVKLLTDEEMTTGLANKAGQAMMGWCKKKHKIDQKNTNCKILKLA